MGAKQQLEYKQPEQSRTSTQLLFDESPEPMLVVNAGTLEFLEVNRAAIQKYGYNRDEFLKLRLTDLVPAEDRDKVKESIQGERSEGSGVCDVRHLMKSGKTVEVDMLVHQIRYARKKAALVIPQDCTHRKQLEEQLRQAQKMEAVGMLAGGIAHDFNNLLTIINGYSQMLLSSLSESDENRSSVEQIMKAGERAAELTRQLLTFSRRQVVRPKVQDLNVVVAGAAVMLRRLIGEHIELRIITAPELAKIHADRSQVEQVIINLAVNSRDAMPTGGTLTIETQSVEFSEPFPGPHTTLKPGRYVMLAVSDTGSGMDEQTRSRLFEPFFTTKAQGQGTGLGLSTVYGIMKQSAGEIMVYSEPDQGTCVKAYFPAASASLPSADTDTPREEAAPGSETVMVVEDDEAVRKLVRDTLEKQGYRLLVAASGPEALSIAERFDSPIELLITDMVMPQMSGRQLAERMKTVRPQTQILFISGYTESAIVQTATLGYENTFLQKPFTPSMLSRAVRELLDKAHKPMSTRAESCSP